LNRVFSGFLIFSSSLFFVAWSLNGDIWYVKLVSILLNVGLFFLLIREVFRYQIGERFLLQGTVILAILTLIIPPRLNTQMNRQLWDAYIQTEGENPYFEHPSSVHYSKYQNSVFYEAVEQSDRVTAASPIEQIVLRLGYLPVQNPLNAAMFIKIVGSLLYILGTWLLIYLLPAQKKIQIAILVWNPGILIPMLAHGLLPGLFLLLFGGLYYVNSKQTADMELVFAGALANLNPAFLLFPLKKRFISLGITAWAIFSASFLVWWLPFFDAESIGRYFLENLMLSDSGLLYSIPGVPHNYWWIYLFGLGLSSLSWLFFRDQFEDQLTRYISVLLVYSILNSAFFPVSVVLLCLLILFEGKEESSWRWFMIASIPVSLFFLK
jgi:hypothetical protein